jgi:hypothetical protein
MTRIGTSYFVSDLAAVEYYRAYENGNTIRAAISVGRKLESGQIHIGKPELKPGQKLSLIDNGTRYMIEEM